MILGFLRVALIGAVVLTVFYVLLSIYSRSLRREALEKEYDEGYGDGPREAYIEAGMKKYEKGLRKKLILLVYIIPAIIFTVVFWTLNYS
ncbi:hypothetical protein ORIO_11875 [Cereibacter azotoformans]|uniref:Cation/multidrug efflux pump n=2 Tax=Cereibacter TaxID=1653176 RepID=A0A2T5K7N7_9RHOB|nr:MULTISPECIES: hypothetical protein [Cereibacter]AXQ94364.1 hypothetical protein D0Z66_11435 [Cereibacter sphaeroides]MBO4167817.1 hypothetical protein [Cereibacter azotoformans]PTR18378.1 hypothetical protein C8J28_10899 [Cereibacter azotoformans]UIJ29907.1 hypothetical protein LV780_11410 [Cereibacter azotoformans]ULB10601.1 hypothetical protein ORIO_11875 [Cereibacter azotoformans]